MQIEVRNFRYGDEKLWVQVVNESFDASKGSTMTTEDIDKYRKHPYFDPDGIFLAFRGSEPVGACWATLGAFYEVRKGHIESFHATRRHRLIGIEKALREKGNQLPQVQGFDGG